MAKFSPISIDVEEIKKNLKNQALIAKEQITVLAKKAQKDLEGNQVFKKVETVLEKVKSQEFTQELLKNPKVQEITKRLITASEQLEKALTKNASALIGEVKARINKPAAKTTTAKKAKKTTTEN